MRRWDRFLDSYMEQYAARGVCAGRVKSTRSALERCEIRLISQTPRLGGMMISEVSDGKAKFYEGVQGRGRSVGA